MTNSPRKRIPQNLLVTPCRYRRTTRIPSTVIKAANSQYTASSRGPLFGPFSMRSRKERDGKRPREENLLKEKRWKKSELQRGVSLPLGNLRGFIRVNFFRVRTEGPVLFPVLKTKLVVKFYPAISHLPLVDIRAKTNSREDGRKEASFIYPEMRTRMRTGACAYEKPDKMAKIFFK